MEKSNQPRVTRVKTTVPIDDLEAFDMMSRFLADEKAKQLSHDFAGQVYLASSSQTWNDIRLACNSLLEENDPRRDPVAAWKEDNPPSLKEEKGESDSEDRTNPEKSTALSPSPPVKEERDDETSSPVMSDKKARKAAKKAKKEAKREAKKIKKEAKKAKKEKKKRKRDDDS